MYVSTPSLVVTPNCRHYSRAYKTYAFSYPLPPPWKRTKNGDLFYCFSQEWVPISWVVVDRWSSLFRSSPFLPHSQLYLHPTYTSFYFPTCPTFLDSLHFLPPFFPSSFPLSFLSLLLAILWLFPFPSLNNAWIMNTIIKKTLAFVTKCLLS